MYVGIYEKTETDSHNPKTQEHCPTQLLNMPAQELGVAHTFNPSTHLVGRGRQISVSSRPAWSTNQVPGQLETQSQKTKQTNKNVNTGGMTA